MVLDSEQVRRLYGRTATLYDAAVWIYEPAGVHRHRRLAVELLGIQPGDTVIDLGTGTGLNLPLLREEVGKEGQVIGVDISDAMLARARRRIQETGWTNVELIEADLTDFEFPPGLDAAQATFALEMVPEHEPIIREVAGKLSGGGRLALYGLKHPEGWLDWLIDIGVWLNRPFGVSREYASIKPWVAARRHLREVHFQELYAGAGYLWVGEAE